MPGMGRRAQTSHSSQGAPAGTLRRLRASTAQKEPLVLLHPFSLCAEVWKPILPALQQSHTVFALKLPGHMGADPFPEDCEHSIEHLAGLLEAQLDALHLE